MKRRGARNLVPIPGAPGRGSSRSGSEDRLTVAGRLGRTAKRVGQLQENLRSQSTDARPARGSRTCYTKARAPGGRSSIGGGLPAGDATGRRARSCGEVGASAAGQTAQRHTRAITLYEVLATKPADERQHWPGSRRCYKSRSNTSHTGCSPRAAAAEAPRRRAKTERAGAAQAAQIIPATRADGRLPGGD